MRRTPTRRKKYSNVLFERLRLDYRRLPFAQPLIATYARRPRLVSWLVLAIGMTFMMTFFSWETGLVFRQWIALVVATLVLAWLCVLVTFLEDEE